MTPRSRRSTRNPHHNASFKPSNFILSWLHVLRSSIPLSSDSDADDSFVFFYNSVKRPKEHICPFFEADRPNSCITHNQPKRRKDVIMHHLQVVRCEKENEQHLLHDPLWDDWIIKTFYLQKRPKRFDRSWRREGQKESIKSIIGKRQRMS